MNAIKISVLETKEILRKNRRKKKLQIQPKSSTEINGSI